jgi:hypothetical protein
MVESRMSPIRATDVVVNGRRVDNHGHLGAASDRTFFTFLPASPVVSAIRIVTVIRRRPWTATAVEVASGCPSGDQSAIAAKRRARNPENSIIRFHVSCAMDDDQVISHGPAVDLDAWPF